MLYMKRAEYEAMAAHCRQELPDEACGLIGGVRRGNEMYAKKIYRMTNVESDRAHFSMEPAEQFAAARDMRADGTELLGSFHSHPAGPAALSEEDVRRAYDTDILYLVLSLADDKPELKAFRVGEAGCVVQEDIVLE